jgi:hypothetical protein
LANLTYFLDAFAVAEAGLGAYRRTATFTGAESVRGLSKGETNGQYRPDPSLRENAATSLKMLGWN